eukprot:SAG25_NODE_9564_length_367_cov_1.238806_1_plen_60_part_01
MARCNFSHGKFGNRPKFADFWIWRGGEIAPSGFALRKLLPQGAYTCPLKKVYVLVCLSVK